MENIPESKFNIGDRVITRQNIEGTITEKEFWPFDPSPGMPYEQEATWAYLLYTLKGWYYEIDLKLVSKNPIIKLDNSIHERAQEIINSLPPEEGASRLAGGNEIPSSGKGNRLTYIEKNCGYIRLSRSTKHFKQTDENLEKWRTLLAERIFIKLNETKRLGTAQLSDVVRFLNTKENNWRDELISTGVNSFVVWYCKQLAKQQ